MTQRCADRRCRCVPVSSCDRKAAGFASFRVRNRCAVEHFCYSLAVRAFPFFLATLLVAGPAALAPMGADAATPQPQETPPPTGATSTPSTRPVIVLDPAHGGTDPGARGENLLEKDVVLEMARTARAELERQGYRVVMTRNDDSNPSYDERAAMANAYRDSIFISLHVSSTGKPGTARAYYEQTALANPTASGAAASNAANPPPPASGLVLWEKAQQAHVDASHHLADAIQAQLAQLFPGSSGAAAPARVRGLRSVASPAVAIEISNVSVAKADSLISLATPLATALVRSIGAFRVPESNGAK